MSTKYIQQIKSGKWKITSSKSGKTLRLMNSKKDAIMYVSAIKATTSIFVKNNSEWVETLSDDLESTKAKKETPKITLKKTAIKKVAEAKPETKKLATVKKSIEKKPIVKIPVVKKSAIVKNQVPVAKKPTKKDDEKKTVKFIDSVHPVKEQGKTSIVAKIFILLFLAAVIAGIFVSAWFLVE